MHYSVSGMDECVPCNLPLALVDNRCVSGQSIRAMHAFLSKCLVLHSFCDIAKISLSTQEALFLIFKKAATCSHLPWSKWLQVAASGCNWLLGPSGCKWLLGPSGCKWLQLAAGTKWLQVAASGCWDQVAASGCKCRKHWRIFNILRWKAPENFEHSPVDGTGEFSTFSGGSKWLQVAAGSKWLQAAASGCKRLSDRSRILQSSGMLPCKILSLTCKSLLLRSRILSLNLQTCRMLRITRTRTKTRTREIIASSWKAWMLPKKILS